MNIYFKGISMGVVSIIVTYLCTWWVVLFCTLPFRGAPHDDLTTGTAGSAPQKTYLRVKVMWTSAISAVIVAILYILIEMDIMDFYEIAAQMRAEDMVR